MPLAARLCRFARRRTIGTQEGGKSNLTDNIFERFFIRLFRISRRRRPQQIKKNTDHADQTDKKESIKSGKSVVKKNDGQKGKV
jgi:hypothetical protein